MDFAFGLMTTAHPNAKSILFFTPHLEYGKKCVSLQKSKLHYGYETQKQADKNGTRADSDGILHGIGRTTTRKKGSNRQPLMAE